MDRDHLRVEWVCPETEADARAAQVRRDGGTVEGTAEFVPHAEETDRFTGQPAGSLVAMVTVMPLPVMLRSLEQTIREARGTGAEPTVEFMDDRIQVRHVPTDHERHVHLKSRYGVRSLAPEEFAAIEKAFLALVAKMTGEDG